MEFAFWISKQIDDGKGSSQAESEATIWVVSGKNNAVFFWTNFMLRSAGSGAIGTQSKS